VVLFSVMARYSAEFKAQLFEVVKRRDALRAVALVNAENLRNPIPKSEFFRDGPTLDEVNVVFSAWPKQLITVPEATIEHLRNSAAMAFLVGDLTHWRWLPQELSTGTHLNDQSCCRCNHFVRPVSRKRGGLATIWTDRGS
jgi:hypothetical protein